MVFWSSEAESNGTNLIYTGGRILGASRLPDVLERCFVVASLMLFSGAVMALLRQGGAGIQTSPAPEDPILRAAYLGIYVVTAFLILGRWRQFARVFVRDRLLLLLIILVLASVVWSVEPMITLRRSVALVGTTMFGFYLASRYSLDEQLRLLAWALGVAAVLSFLFAIALPGYGTQAEFAGAWRGVYVHKNTLGNAMVLGTAIFLLLAVGGRLRVAWVGFGLSVGLVLLSGSRSSLVLVLAFLLLLPLYRALRLHINVAIPLLITAVLSVAGVASVLVRNAEAALGMLGRDLTLTDRTALWPLVLDEIRDRPWLGYGYDGFWHGWGGESAYLWLLGWKQLAAHNGYLELWLHLGLLGFLVFALGFSFAYLRAMVWARRAPSVIGLWPALFLSLMLLRGLTESTFVNHNSLWWVLYASPAALTTFRPSTAGRSKDRPRWHHAGTHHVRPAKLPTP